MLEFLEQAEVRLCVRSRRQVLELDQQIQVATCLVEVIAQGGSKEIKSLDVIASAQRFDVRTIHSERFSNWHGRLQAIDKDTIGC